jgi:hypothetical protein
MTWGISGASKTAAGRPQGVKWYGMAGPINTSASPWIPMKYGLARDWTPSLGFFANIQSNLKAIFCMTKACLNSTHLFRAFKFLVAICPFQTGETTLISGPKHFALRCLRIETQSGFNEDINLY